MKFIDCNSPGCIFVGEQVHCDGLSYLGGHPCPISDELATKLMTDPGDDEGPWTLQDAPPFWANNNGKPD